MAYEPKVRWLKSDGRVMSCFEKIKVMRQNLLELHQAAQDVLDDAVLMGTTHDEVKAELRRMVDTLQSDMADLLS